MSIFSIYLYHEGKLIWLIFTTIFLVFNSIPSILSGIQYLLNTQSMSEWNGGIYHEE